PPPSAPRIRAALALLWSCAAWAASVRDDELVLSGAIRSNAAQGWRRRDGLRPRLSPVNAPNTGLLRQKRLTFAGTVPSVWAGVGDGAGHGYGSVRQRQSPGRSVGARTQP